MNINNVNDLFEHINTQMRIIKSNAEIVDSLIQKFKNSSNFKQQSNIISKVQNDTFNEFFQKTDKKNDNNEQIYNDETDCHNIEKHEKTSKLNSIKNSDKNIQDKKEIVIIKEEKYDRSSLYIKNNIGMKLFLESINDLNFDPIFFPSIFQTKDQKCQVYKREINKKTTFLYVPRNLKTFQEINKFILKNIIPVNIDYQGIQKSLLDKIYFRLNIC